MKRPNPREGVPAASYHEQRVALNARAWPGITAGLDARCSCTWAPYNGVYQVKIRDRGCLTHGGPLAACLARMERQP
jgi:hypothetical protein